jgi:DNA polymerase-3 subunit delta'
MSFDAILGQDAAIASLCRMVAGGRIPSALLFLGPHHVGKRTTALTLAKALNCARGDGDSCDECPSCRKIDEGVHADVETVAPEGQFIRIHQVRGVTDRLGLIPFEARKRVVIVSRAERMHPAAANAFLKTLEEPPGNTLIILCAQDRGRLFETIVSRCLPLRFGLLAEGTVRKLLSAQGVAPEALEFAVSFAQGRVRADLRERAGQWMIVRDELIQGMSRLDAPAFGRISEQFARWAGSEDWRFVLEWLETWFRDLALPGDRETEHGLINRDRLEPLREWRGRFSAPVAEACYHRVLATREAILLNASKPLALEALWLACKEFALQGRGGAAP